MARREIKVGDYFLTPFAGKRIDLLVQAVEFHPTSGHWYVRNAKDGGNGPTRLALLSSCRRCSPAQAAKILAAAGVRACSHPLEVDGQPLRCTHCAAGVKGDQRG